MAEGKKAELVQQEQVRKDLIGKPLGTAQNVDQLLKLYEEPLRRLAPKTLDVERMMRIAVMIAGRNPKLREATGLSLLGAIMTATQMGLDIGMGLAHLVPFRNNKNNTTEVQLIPDYKGLIELVTNTGRITSIRAVPVFLEDDFTYEEGAEPKLIHRPKQRSLMPEDLFAVYSVARYPDGFLDFELMFKNEVDRIRDRSLAKSGGPWKDHYIEMAKKTVIKRHCKRLPKSIELVTAIGLDDRASMGVPQQLQITETASGPVVDVAPDFQDDEIDQPEKKEPQTGSIDMSRAKAGDQTPPPDKQPPVDTSLFPEEADTPKLISKSLQDRLLKAALDSGWKESELTAYLSKEGIPEGDRAKIPAPRYDELMMKVLAGGDPGVISGEQESTDEAEDDGILATDEDWAKIRKAAKAGGRDDKEITAYVRSLGIRLNSKLPKSKVADLLTWALGD